MSKQEQANRIADLTKRVHTARVRLSEHRQRLPLLADHHRKFLKAIDDDKIPLAAVLVKECPSIADLEEVILGIEQAEQEIAECEQDITRLVKTPIG